MQRSRAMDLAKVRTAPGVVAVIVAADIPGPNDVSPVAGDDPMFAEGLVEYWGQSLFAVAAETREAAWRAAQLADIAYEERPAILTIDEAMEAASYLEKPYIMARGDAAAAIDAAPCRISGRIEIGGQEHFYLEGQAALAIPGEDEDVTVYSSTQHPSEIQHKVASVLGIDNHAVTVEVRRMGGGFGGKESQGNLPACAAALIAKLTRRPAKAVYDRDDDMMITGKRHDFRIDYRAGFDDDGRILGVEFDQALRCGMSWDLSEPIGDRAMFHADNCYYLPDVRITSYRCKTHTQSNTAFRGFGGPQGMVGMERVIDHIAHELGKDPLEVRRINFYDRKGSDTGRSLTPYSMAVEDCIIEDIVDELVETSDYRRRREEIRAWNAASPILKRGIALTPVKFGISFTKTFLNQAGALVNVYTDGSIQLNHGGTEMGQGLFTKVAQVVAEEFQVDIACVKITATTTGKVPNTSATAASAGSDLNGMAAQHAARTIKRRLADFLAERFQTETGACRIPARPHPRRRDRAVLRVRHSAGLHGARAALRDRLLRDAENQLGQGGGQGAAVLLFRLWRGGDRGRDRHADRREPALARRYSPRCRPVAEPGHRPRPDRGRLRAGRRLADHGGTGVGCRRPADDARAVDLQDPRLFRPPAGYAHPAFRPRRERGGDDLSLQGRRRAAADAGHFRAHGAVRCRRECGRQRRISGARRASNAGAHSVRRRAPPHGRPSDDGALRHRRHSDARRKAHCRSCASSSPASTDRRRARPAPRCW